MTISNVPARAATSGDLAAFRSDGQASILGLAIEHPATVYTARVNQTFDTLDGVSQLTYDGGSGTLADVLEGMTVFIGSAAGLRDKGVTRIRKTPSATVFYIGQTSKIQFSNDDYITVVDSMSIWARDITNAGGVVRMDYDIEFGDLTRGGLVARLGPVSTVINQTTGTITFTPCNPSITESYEIGVTVDSYEFDAPGASTTSNMTDPATASWTYPLTANQEYRWSCAITDSLGRVTTGYRRVFVNPTTIPFTVGNCNTDGSDWSFEITNYADVSAIHPRAMVTLYATDYYMGQKGSIGKLAGYENILAVGWIDGASIEQDVEKGTVSFSVKGAAYWMGRVKSPPIAFVDTSDIEKKWTEITALTVDKAIARLIYWASTAPLIMDVFLTGNTVRQKVLSEAGDSLFGQIQSMASSKIFANAAVNSYGQMFVSVDQQIIDSTARAALPVVMDITSADYIAPLELEYNEFEKTAMVELGAASDYDGRTSSPIYSRAPGNTPDYYGVQSSFDNYAIVDQDECNRIAGCLLAMENNEYEPISISFAANIRLFDIAPRMWATITTNASENPAGIALTAARLIPRRCGYNFGSGIIKTEVEFEVEVIGVDGISYFPPTVQDNNIDTGIDMLDTLDNVDFPTSAYYTESLPPEVPTPCDGTKSNAYSINFTPRTLTGSTEVLIGKALFPCTVRATGGEAGDTFIKIRLAFKGDAISHTNCYAFVGDTRVLTATAFLKDNDDSTFFFSPLSDTAVDGFEIELDAGAGAVIEEYEVGKIIETGNMGDATTMCETGKYYALEAYTGYWRATFPAPIVGLDFWNTKLLPSNEVYYGGNGRRGNDFTNDGFTLSSYNGVFAEPILPYVWNPDTEEFDKQGNYARIYFLCGASPQQTLYPSDTLTLGLTIYDMKWRLREAQALGRRVIIGSGLLLNVCEHP